MGTRFELVLPTGGTHGGRTFRSVDYQAIGELVMAEVEEWHQRLSRFALDSWVSHVNRTAAHEPVRCDDDTWALLSDAQQVWRDSAGAFDVTRGDGDALILDASAYTVRFARPGVSIDFGGIGKGHALDCSARLLRGHGVTSAFLHGGTSSGIALGLDPAGHLWRVLMEPKGFSPWDNARAEALALHDTAFAVSDAASQATAHIIDPRSKMPIDAPTPRPVVVTGPSARVCDAWATALVVLGRAPVTFPIGYAHGETTTR